MICEAGTIVSILITIKKAKPEPTNRRLHREIQIKTLPFACLPQMQVLKQPEVSDAHPKRVRVAFS
jgi:hypothetical protein